MLKINDDGSEEINEKYFKDKKDDKDNTKHDDAHGTTGKTSTNDGHSHKYVVDQFGSGLTNQVDGHGHEVRQWKVQVADNHIHKIVRDTNDSTGVETNTPITAA